MIIKTQFIFTAFVLLLYSQDFAYKNNIDEAYRAYQSKNYNKASELFEYEINNSPILKVEYFEILANIYMYQKDFQNMLRVSRNGIIVNRFSPKLYFQKGYALYKLGQTNEAIDSLRHSVDLKPDDAYVNNFLGLLYLYSENYKLAESSFLKANIYNPNNVVYMINLAATYERDKNYASALQVYEEVYKLDKNYRDVSGSISRVRTLLGFTNDTEKPSLNENYQYDEDTEVKPINETNN